MTDVSAIIAGALELRNSNYVTIASSTWFLWDWIVSLDQEIGNFWRTPFNVGSVLYFSNRFIYLLLLLIHYQTAVRPLTEEQSVPFCRPFIYLLFGGTAISTSIVQMVLTLRTYALWDTNKRVLWPLHFLNLGSFVVQIVLLGLRGYTTQILYNPFPAPYNGCVLVFVEEWTWERFIPILAFEVAVLGLMLVRFCQYAVAGKSSQITYVLFRDGFIEFIAVGAASLFGLAIELTQQKGGTLFTLSFHLTPAVAAVCCSRMLLNIRDVMSMAPLDETTGTITGGRQWGIMGERSAADSQPLSEHDIWDAEMDQTKASNLSGKARELPSDLEDNAYTQGGWVSDDPGNYADISSESESGSAQKRPVRPLAGYVGMHSLPDATVTSSSRLPQPQLLADPSPDEGKSTRQG